MRRFHEEVVRRRAKAVVLREQGNSLSSIARQLGYSDHSGIRSLLAAHEYEFHASAVYRKAILEERYKLGRNSVETR